MSAVRASYGSLAEIGGNVKIGESPRSATVGVVAAALVLVLAAGSTGCARTSSRDAGGADTTGTVVGRLHGEFVHGYSPFYGSAVYLIPVTPATERWWLGFARPRFALIDPSQATSIGFQARTTAAQDGRFAFDDVPPGRYYVYGRVVWAITAKDTTSFGGDAWLGKTKVAPRDTARVILRNRRSVFPPDSVPARR